MWRTRVDLPLPFWPTTATDDPAGIVRSTPARARVPSEYTNPTPSSRTSVMRRPPRVEPARRERLGQPHPRRRIDPAIGQPGVNARGPWGGG